MDDEDDRERDDADDDDDDADDEVDNDRLLRFLLRLCFFSPRERPLLEDSEPDRDADREGDFSRDP